MPENVQSLTIASPAPATEPGVNEPGVKDFFDTCHQSDPRLSDVATGADLASALAAHEMVLLVEDLHRWDSTVVNLLTDMSASPSRQPSVVATSNSVPLPLRKTIVLTARDLAFTPSEVAEECQRHGVSDTEAHRFVHTVTGGWPIAVGAAIKQLAGAADPSTALGTMIRSPRVVEKLVAKITSALDAENAERAEQLAVLPRFDQHIAGLLGDPQLIDGLRRADLPIIADEDEWMRFAEPFASHLANRADPGDVPAGLIDHFASTGDLEEALETAMTLGAHSEVARVLATTSVDDALSIEIGYLNGLITAIGESALSHPRCLQIVAQANGPAGRFEEGFSHLQRAAEHFSAADPELADPQHVELLTELGVWQFFAGQDELATLTVRACENATGDDPVLCARLLDLKGLMSSQGNSVDALNTARAQLTESLAIWRSIGDTRAAINTGCRLANNVLWSLGRRKESLELLESLLQVGSVSLLDQARIALFAAMAMPSVGRARDVADRLTEARRIAPLLGLSWIESWADWAEAVAASVVGDCTRVVELADKLEAEQATIGTSVTTASMWTEVAEALARCGEATAARRVMQRAYDLQALPDWFLDFAEVSLLARLGDPAEALQRLESYGLRPDAEPDRRWLGELLSALAHHRMGDAEQSDKHMINCRNEARAIHQPDIADILEAEIMARLRQPPGSPEVVGSSGTLTTISVFGEFSVNVAGKPVVLPLGQVTNVVKMLVVNDRRMVVDLVVDALWPDADLEVGRRRLRNVVLRVRQTCGDILERSGEVLSLNDQASSDWDEARQLAQAASPDAELALLNRAAEVWRQPLLPDDLYEPWAEAARSQQRQARARLLRLLATRHEDLGDRTAAIEALLELDEVEGDYGTQAERIARLRCS